jgi:riboflavin kinase/FMN adenylyltransferase
MGCFDGVHLGHQKVIATAVEQAEKLGGEAWVYTFNPHPAKVLVPEKAPPLISAEPCRLRRMKALGIAGIIETPFTLEFAALTPDEFLNDLIAKAPALAGVVCGQDWSFGCRASGNFQTLETFGKQHGFSATAVAPVMDGDHKISSTAIRKAITDGDIPTAAALLGRPFSLFGKVIEGRKVGRRLGFPTANVDPLNELLPGQGIFSARTNVDGNWIDSAVFIGARKTFGCDQHVIESYLIDFDGDLYGKDIEIILIEKIRDIHAFPSKDALIEQIKKDVAQIRELLNFDSTQPIQGSTAGRTATR